jgi:hypothetical protein
MLTATIALADEPVVAPAGGSALCVWEIYVTLLAYADACGLNPNSEKRDALQDSAELVRRFILENSDITPLALADTRAKIFADYRELKIHDTQLCDPADESGVGGMYRNQLQSPAEMRA